MMLRTSATSRNTRKDYLESRSANIMALRASSTSESISTINVCVTGRHLDFPAWLARHNGCRYQRAATPELTLRQV